MREQHSHSRQIPAVSAARRPSRAWSHIQRRRGLDSGNDRWQIVGGRSSPAILHLDLFQNRQLRSHGATDWPGSPHREKPCGRALACENPRRRVALLLAPKPASPQAREPGLPACEIAYCPRQTGRLRRNARSRRDLQQRRPLAQGRHFNRRRIGSLSKPCLSPQIAPNFTRISSSKLFLLIAYDSRHRYA